MSATHEWPSTGPELIALVREYGPGSVSRLDWLEQVVGYDDAARFLEVGVRTLRTDATRPPTKDGTPRMPRPDQRLGRSPGWKLRTLVLHRASLPGQGAKGRPKPGSGKRKVSV